MYTQVATGEYIGNAQITILPVKMLQNVLRLFFERPEFTA